MVLHTRGRVGRRHFQESLSSEKNTGSLFLRYSLTNQTINTNQQWVVCGAGKSPDLGIVEVAGKRYLCLRKREEKSLQKLNCLTNQSTNQPISDKRFQNRKKRLYLSIQPLFK